MNAKLVAGGITADDSEAPELLNPFVHHLSLDSTTEKIKTAVLTIVLLPIRVAVICLLLILGWLLACIGLFGVSEEDLRTKPVTGWRSTLKVIVSRITSWMFPAGGFKIKIIGERSSRAEAPVVALAPHSSFMDSVVMMVMGGPSIVAKGETAYIPFFGKLINFTQPVYVWRDDPDSRQNTIREIINRATSDLDWPQILIFPEGTCTNRSCLITFKPGAFYPGVPIQPVCIRYPNKLDTVTWTWEGPSALKLLWLTLTQVYSSCEIEFLPVYRPSEEEKRDPKLFANNVRAVMAKALGVPVSDYTYDDCKLFSKAKEMNLPNANALVEVTKLRNRLNLQLTKPEENIVMHNIRYKDYSRISFSDFISILKVNPHDANAHQMYRLYDKNCTGIIDFREYLLGVLALTDNRSTLETLKMGCKIYDRSGCGKLTIEDFATVLMYTMNMQEHEAYDVFYRIDKNSLGFITFENFKTFAEKKAEFAGLFSISKEEKFTPKNGQVCPGEPCSTTKKAM